MANKLHLSTGYIQSPADNNDAKFKYELPLKFARVLPPTADVRQWLPPIYDQLNLGACVAWMVKTLMATCYIKLGLSDPDLSALMLYYLARARAGELNLGDIGCTPRDALKAANKTGICLEALWPYIIELYNVKPPEACYQDAANHKILGYHIIEHDLRYMKACIADGFPYGVGIVIKENFPQDPGIWDIPMPQGDELGGHAGVIVAYDDAVQKFLFRSTWGVWWGSAGYATIPYAFMENPEFTYEAWTVRLLAALPGSVPAQSDGCKNVLAAWIASLFKKAG
jgi:C1A family cysteine protease